MWCDSEHDVLRISHNYHLIITSSPLQSVHYLDVACSCTYCDESAAPAPILSDSGLDVSRGPHRAVLMQLRQRRASHSRSAGMAPRDTMPPLPPQAAQLSGNLPYVVSYSQGLLEQLQARGINATETQLIFNSRAPGALRDRVHRIGFSGAFHRMCA